jgi:hypothetical protein
MSRHVIALTLLFGSHAPTAEPEPVFPIMAWNNVPNDPAVLKRMRDCGLTVAGFVPIDGLDNCHSAGMKAIVSDARLSDYDWTKVDPTAARKRVGEVIQRVRRHPAVYGYYLRDEPPAGYFAGLATVASVIKERHPGAWPYVNLFPNYAETWQLAAPNYETYLDKFVDVCKPPVLSYDHYALLEGGGMRGDYFANLAAMRRVAVKHNLPFWNIVLSAAHLGCREVSAADLRFQAYTSLAYGAKGLAYFTYFAAPVGNHRMAPVDQFGHETATWQWMQNVNLQVGKLGPTLLKLTSDRVYHFGPVPAGASGPDDKSLVKAIGGPMLVGDFTQADGTRYVLIVNTDLAHSLPALPQFRESWKVQQVSAYTGGPVPHEGEYVWLAPGQGVLLKLSK